MVKWLFQDGITHNPLSNSQAPSEPMYHMFFFQTINCWFYLQWNNMYYKYSLN